MYDCTVGVKTNNSCHKKYYARIIDLQVVDDLSDDDQRLLIWRLNMSLNGKGGFTICLASYIIKQFICINLSVTKSTAAMSLDYMLKIK